MINKTKTVQKLALLCLVITGFKANGTPADDFLAKLFELETIIANPKGNITTLEEADSFASKAEEALALMGQVLPPRDDINLATFSFALSNAQTAYDENSYLAQQKTRVNSLLSKLVDYQAGKPLDFGGGTTSGYGVPTGFVKLTDFVSKKYKQIYPLSSLGLTDATTLASTIYTVVNTFAAGIIDVAEISSVKAAINLVKNHRVFKGDDRLSARNKLDSAIAKFATGAISYGERIEFLGRIIDPTGTDLTFAAGEGETRFLKIVEYLIQNFTQLSYDEKLALQFVLQQAVGQNTYNQNTVRVLQGHLDSSSLDWQGTTVVAPPPNTGGGVTNTTIILPAADGDIKVALPGYITKLRDRLVYLAAESDYNVFLGDCELIARAYNRLVGNGTIIKTPAAGQSQDVIVSQMQSFAAEIVNNYRFQDTSTKASPYKMRVKNIQNIVLGILSLDQILDQYSGDAAKVNNDLAAAELVTRIKNEIFYNSDGTTLKDSFNKLTTTQKNSLSIFLSSLRGGFFGGVDTDIEGLISIARDGIGITQNIAVLQTLLPSVNYDNLNEFINKFVALKDQALKLRKSNKVSDKDFNALLDFAKSIRDSNTVFWRLKGNMSPELLGIINELSQPVALVDRVKSFKDDVINMKDNPNSVLPGDIDITIDRMQSLITDWQLARIINPTIVPDNATFIGLLNTMIRMPEFYNHSSNLTTLQTTITSPISQDVRIQTLLDFMQNRVISAESSNAYDILDFIKVVTMLSVPTELSNMTQAQRDSFRLKLNTAKMATTKFTQAQIGTISVAYDAATAYESGTITQITVTPASVQTTTPFQTLQDLWTKKINVVTSPMAQELSDFVSLAGSLSTNSALAGLTVTQRGILRDTLNSAKGQTTKFTTTNITAITAAYDAVVAYIRAANATTTTTTTSSGTTSSSATPQSLQMNRVVVQSARESSVERVEPVRRYTTTGARSRGQIR